MEDRFCIIIGRYCESINDFIHTIKNPTKHTLNKIRNKTRRTSSFDDYVSNVQILNELLLQITKKLKEIIFTLNELFIHKSIDSLTNFITAVHVFLSYLVHEDILDKLDGLEVIKTKYDKKAKLIKNATKVKFIIFRIFNIALEITTKFIPQVSMAKDILDTLDGTIDSFINNQEIEYKNELFGINEICKKLIAVELDSEILTRIDFDVINNCLKDKNADELLKRLDIIKLDYIEIYQCSIQLKSEINRYNKKEVYKPFTFVGSVKKFFKRF